MAYAGVPDVALPIPAGWEDRSQVIIVSGDEERTEFRPNIVVVREDRQDRGMQEFVDDHVDNNLRTTFPGMTLMLNEPAEFGPYRGNLIDYEFEAGGKAYRQRQFMVMSDDTIYTFTYSNVVATFEREMVALEQVVGNTRIGFLESGPDGFDDR